MTNQKRQPKGIENGGQFAPDVNPESTVDLGASRVTTGAPFADAASLTAAERIELGMPPTTPTIAEREKEILEIEARYEAAYEDADWDDLISLKNDVIDQQKGIIEAMRLDREENPSLKDIVCMRTFDYLNEGDDVEEHDHADGGDYGSDGRGAQDPLSIETIAADFDRYEMDEPQGRDWDGAFQGIDYVVESLVDWRIADQAKVDKVS